MNRLLVLLLSASIISGCNLNEEEELYTTKMLNRLNEEIADIAANEMAALREVAEFQSVIHMNQYRASVNFYNRSDFIYNLTPEKPNERFENFVSLYNIAMDSIADLANSKKYLFYHTHVEPTTELLQKSDYTQTNNLALLVAKMKNDILVNTHAVLRFYNFKGVYDNIFGDEGNHELEIDTTGLAATKTFKLKLDGIRYRDTLSITRDMITITSNGKDITDQIEFEEYEYEPDVVGTVEMKTIEAGDYRFTGTFDIYLQRKEFLLHLPFDFKFTIK